MRITARMTTLAKLRSQHGELMAIVRQLGNLIDSSIPPPQLQLFDLRRQLSLTLIGHLKAEDWVLYPRLLASADGQIASTAHTFCVEMGGLAAAYIDYCEKWNANAITRDWAGYCKDSREFIDSLVIRITRENRELYPLLERLDHAA
jgi:hypothetical protein